MKLNYATICKSHQENRDTTIEREFLYIVAVCMRMATKGHGQHVFHDVALEGDNLKQLVKMMTEEGFTVRADEFLCKFRVRWDGNDWSYLDNESHPKTPA